MGKPLLAVGLALIVGLAGGYWLGRRDLPPAPVDTRPFAPTRTTKQEAVIRPSPFAATQPTAGIHVSGDTIGFLRALEALRKKGVLSFGIQIFGGDGKLSAGARELFKITDAEAAVLDQATAAARQRLAEIEASVASAKNNPDSGQLVITVPPYPELGGKVYDDVTGQFRDTLGPERNALMQEIARNQIESNMGGFGLAERTITLERKTDSSGQEMIVMQDAKQATTGLINGRTSEGWSSQSGGQFPNRDQLMTHLGPLGTKLVPANF
jgi:hypothetical protein